MIMILNRAILSGVRAVQVAVTHIVHPADAMCGLYLCLVRFIKRCVSPLVLKNLNLTFSAQVKSN